MSGLATTGSAVRSAVGVMGVFYVLVPCLAARGAQRHERVRGAQRARVAALPSRLNKKAARVEQVARVEFALDGPHQAAVAARLAPDRQPALPRRRAAGDDEIPL